MNYIKKRFSDFIHDQWQWSSVIANALLVVCFAYFYHDSAYEFAPLCYAVFFLTYIFTVLLFGRRGILVMFTVFIYFAVQDITFINCTLFILLLGLALLWPKWELPLILLYALDIILVCHRHDKTVIHLLVHGILCLVFYWFFNLVVYTIRQQAFAEISKDYKKLELTKDEEKVVSELSKGKMLKEITGFSKNTKTKLLQTACARNNMGKPELLAMYSIQHNIEQSHR